ncbi:MAG: M23 family metallopeptidase [Nitriliruptorales bacterium]|nr:M23 family metallopeptidase [Nitriliruptorales bacterium]
MAPLRRTVVAAACAGALALPLPAHADDVRASASTASVIRDGLAGTIGQLDAAERRSNDAEFRRRVEEAALSAAVVERLAATRDMQQTRHELAIARVRLVRAQRALAVEERLLGAQLVETYRFGGPAAQAEMAWRVLTESSNPLEAARAMDELGEVVGFQADVVEEHRAAVRQRLVEERVAERRHRTAMERLAAAVAREAAATATVEVELARAAVAERAVLAAIDNLFRAEEELIADGHDPVEVLEASGHWLSILPRLEAEVAVASADPTHAHDDPGPDEPVALADRREWLENRHAALASELALSRAERRLRDNWVCPLSYGEFTNDYHYPRSHGRRHKGLDMFSTIGTPIVAIQSGFVVTRDETDNFNGEYDLGGVTVTIATRPDRPWRVDQSLLPDDGDATEEWYYAHLDAIADEVVVDAWIEAGQVIGWVGDTGNARGTPPHLHLGWQVGNRNVNPFPSMAVACSPDRPQAGRIG